MGSLTNRQRMEGGVFHVADCHVWAEIYYLDSPTDYREYLSASVPLQTRATREPMVLLDDHSSPNFWSLAKFFLGLSIPLLLILLIVTWHD